MANIEKEKGKPLAEEHWEWLEGYLHKIFVDGFIHGYKHGQDDKEKEVKDG